MSQAKTCPVCEYPHAREVWTATDRLFHTTLEKFQLLRCASCRMIFLDEAQVRDRLADFYPTGYWWKESGSTGALERRYRDWMVRNDQFKFCREVLGPDFSGRLLDIGCGSGTFLKVAREAGLDAFGLEVSGEAAELAAQQAPGRVFQGTEQQLMEAGEQFDAVTLFHTLEHLPQPFQYLKKLQKLFRRPGTLIIQVPNCDSLQARLLGRRWHGLDCPRHVYNYSTFAIMHLLGRAGYRIKRLEHFSLRDNACALVSSLLPGLDPMAGRVRALARNRERSALVSTASKALYLSLMLLAQPLARLESALGRGATIFLAASLD